MDVRMELKEFNVKYWTYLKLDFIFEKLDRKKNQIFSLLSSSHALLSLRQQQKISSPRFNLSKKKQ
jgi:hypothetical protein